MKIYFKAAEGRWGLPLWALCCYLLYAGTTLGVSVFAAWQTTKAMPIEFFEAMLSSHVDISWIFGMLLALPALLTALVTPTWRGSFIRCYALLMGWFCTTTLLIGNIGLVRMRNQNEFPGQINSLPTSNFLSVPLPLLTITVATLLSFWGAFLLLKLQDLVTKGAWITDSSWDTAWKQRGAIGEATALAFSLCALTMWAISAAVSTYADMVIATWQRLLTLWQSASERLLALWQPAGQGLLALWKSPFAWSLVAVGVAVAGLIIIGRYRSFIYRYLGNAFKIILGISAIVGGIMLLVLFGWLLFLFFGFLLTTIYRFLQIIFDAASPLFEFLRGWMFESFPWRAVFAGFLVINGVIVIAMLAGVAALILHAVADGALPPIKAWSGRLYWRFRLSYIEALSGSFGFGHPARSGEEWLARVKGGNSYEQAYLLSAISYQSLGLQSDRELLDLVEQCESFVEAEPAEGVYWQKRHELEESLKHERAGLRSAPG